MPGGGLDTASMAHTLSRQIADTARFTAVHAGLVPEDEASLPWLVTGAVLMMQQACTLALHEAEAELPVMPGPGELAVRVGDEACLVQPYTVPLKPEHYRALEELINARNGVMHPKPDGLDIETGGLPDGLVVATRLVRHLVITQPVRPSMVDTDEAASIGHSLELIDSAVDFWRTVAPEG